MKERITKENEKEICLKYKTSTIEAIAREYHIDGKRIRKILVSNNIELVNPRKQTKPKEEWDYVTEISKRYPSKEGYKYIAKSKIDGSAFNDYINISGALSSHIKKKLKIEIPPLYARKKIFKETKRLWHEEWFDIELIKDIPIEVKKCPYCDWTTTDLENKSGAFLSHLINEHGITKEEHLKKYPEDKDYLRLVNSTEQLQFEENTDKFVVCAICGKKLSRIDWRHLDKHGISQAEYEDLYSGSTVSNSLHDVCSENARIHNMNFVFHKESKAEREIREFIISNGITDIICQDRQILGDGKEIDIVIPSLKVCIEFDGNFYHSEWGGKKNKDYHYNKTIKCKEKGYKLIHIFEDEYEYQKDLVFNKLGHILGIKTDKPRVSGRKCLIREISSTESDAFLDKYHIQGSTRSRVHLGCFYQDELIGVMLFRYDKGYGMWELTRFATNYNYICQGVGGKLFKYFVRNYNPNMIKSFADRRWTINEESNVYLKLGFKFDSYTKPNYMYVKLTDSIKRYHKFGFRKEKLHKKYGLPLTMTETQMVKKLGYDRIWDCGLIKYIWERK